MRHPRTPAGDAPGATSPPGPWDLGVYPFGPGTCERTPGKGPLALAPDRRGDAPATAVEPRSAAPKRRWWQRRS
ncbi:hypothetical protein ACXNSR_17300 [Streptomyces sp. NC-S4]